MKSMQLENELNKLATEILSQKEVMTNLFTNITTQVNTTKGDKLEKGFNFLSYSNLVYAFTRFFPLANTSLLSVEAIELKESIKSELSQYQELMNNKQDLPQELKEFLSK